MADWISFTNNLQTSLGISGLCISIVLLSYLSEDLAIVAAALLSVDNTLSAPLALLAIFIGIASGDIALYGVGKWASRWRALRYRLLTNRSMKNVRNRLRVNPIRNIAIIRFIPGLRTLGFTLSGLFSINFYHFAFAVFIATSAWTALVFYSVYQIGSVEWLVDSPWKWIIAPCAVATLWLVNRTASSSNFWRSASVTPFSKKPVSEKAYIGAKVITDEKVSTGEKISTGEKVVNGGKYENR